MPATKETLRLSRHEIIAAIVLAVGVVFGSFLVTRGVEGASKPSLDIEQCANLAGTCDASTPSNWQKGNLGQSNSMYLEGQSVPYRSVITGLTPAETYALRIEWDSTESGKHALDFLTSFDRTESGADPCAVALCTGGGETLGVPLDPHVSDAGVVQIGGQVFHLWGGTFPASGAMVTNSGNLCGTASCTITANPSSYSRSGDFTGSSQTGITVYFTANAPTAVLAWGGHIASRVDWGFGKSAVDLSGSPYHMRLTDFRCSNVANCSAGKMDLSLSSTAVVFPGTITIVKDASIEGDTSFDFSASPSPLGPFVLVDDGSGSNTRVFSGLTSFQQYVVEELAEQGWDFDEVRCELIVDHGGTYETDGPSVVIDLAEGENITCTFFNTAVTTSSTTSTSTSSTSTSTSTSTTTTTPGGSTSTSTSAPGGSTTSTPISTSTTSAPTFTVPAGIPILPAQVTTTTAAPSATTTTEPAPIRPAETIGGELPATGGSARLLTVIGLLLITLGALGLALIFTRSALTKGPRS